MMCQCEHLFLDKDSTYISKLTKTHNTYNGENAKIS